MIVHPGLEAQLAHRLPARGLGDAVDDAAGAAAPEGHRVRAAEDLEPLDIVEVAIGLDVVADAVDEEVAGGRDAAEDQGFAIALALAEKTPGV